MTNSIKTEVPTAEHTLEMIVSRCNSSLCEIDETFEYDESVLSDAKNEAMLPLSFIARSKSSGHARVDFERVVEWSSWFAVEMMKAVPAELIDKCGEFNLYYIVFNAALDTYVWIHEEE